MITPSAPGALRRGPAQVVGFVLPLLFLLLCPSLLAQFPSFTILEADTHGGTAYVSPQAGELGAALAGGHDATGDGLPELLAGAPGTGEGAGQAFLILGRGRRPLLVKLGEGEGTVTFTSVSPRADRLGVSVAFAGDVDGDRLSDFLLGVPQSSEAPGGGAVLVFGRASYLAQYRLPADVPRLGLFLACPDPGAAAGRAVAGVGDVNGDGFPDLAVGAPRAAGGRGRTFVVFGGPALRAAFREGRTTLDLQALPEGAGLVIQGPAEGAGLGMALGGGDLDGDGISDLVLGSPGLSPPAAFLVFGARALAVPDLAAADGQRVVRISGGASDGLGAALAAGGDATGDGIADLLLGAPDHGDLAAARGAVYLLAGGAHLRGAAALEARAGRPGVVALLGGRLDRAGSSVALAPDTSGDSTAEILIGAPGGRSGRGLAYLVYGKAGLPAVVELDGLDPPLGATLLTNVPEARVGAAVSGLGDRSGDGRGDLAVGAPGAGLAGLRGGVVFEVRAPSERPLAAPRDLTCRVLPGKGVSLAWINGGRYRGLEVLRDRVRIATLPPEALYYIDTEPQPGEHAYALEADADPSLLSNTCRVVLQSLLVHDLHCEQIPGTTRVLVSWRPGDSYLRLAVRVNDRVLREDLPGQSTSFEFDLGAGSYLVEVFDPENGPDAASQRCEVRVVPVRGQAVSNLTCVLANGEGSRAVDLRWDPDPAFTRYIVSRDGLPLAKVVEASYRDLQPPPGLRTYQVVGLVEDLHPSLPARCAAEVPGAGGARVRGRVVFDDPPGTPLGLGRVRVLDAARATLGDGQVGADGQFEVPVPGGSAPAAVLFEVTVPALGLTDPRPLHGIRVEASIPAAGELEVRVPVPVLAVSGLGEGPLRWKPLLERLEAHRQPAGLLRGKLAFALAGQGDLSRSVASLREGIQAVRRHLRANLAAEPAQIDLVAHGFSGLAARAYLHAVAAGEKPVRRLVLLGAPHQGTPIAGLDAQAAAPRRFFLPGLPDRERDTFTAAAQQIPVYLEEFNRRFTNLRGAETHLVAGLGGADPLDAVLRCPEHDGRVCRESALGLAGARVHSTAELHENLGRGAASLELLSSILISGPARGAAEPGGGGAGIILGPVVTGEAYSSVLAEGIAGELELLSDTSGSIIIILNNELPGSIDFSLRTPGGMLVEPASAGLPGIDYHSFGDGEGHQVQSYEFETGEVGLYTAFIANRGPQEVAYSLQIYVDSLLTLSVGLAPREVALGEAARLTADLRLNGSPVQAAAVEARINRPDGSDEQAVLLDDGVAPDASAGDGLYTAVLPATAVPGLHLVTVRASGSLPLPFLRAASDELVVRSPAAAFREGFTSGTEAAPAGGWLGGVWVDGEVEAREAGLCLVLGKLTDLEGSPVGETGAMLSVTAQASVGFRLLFDAEGIYGSRRDGPYVLRSLELLDGARGFIPCERRQDVLTTGPYSWEDFGGEDAPPRFVRGDANADGLLDLSDALTILGSLFAAGFEVTCPDAADANADRSLDITDAIYLLTSLFLDGSPLPPPGPACGSAPALGCPRFEPCGN